MECPFCQASCDDFEESDDHLIEHVSEYQSTQDSEFSQYTDFSPKRKHK